MTLPEIENAASRSEAYPMKKYLTKTLFLAVCIVGLSLSAFAQKPGDKKPPKRDKKNPPSIKVLPKKNRPKNDKKKPKKPEFGGYLFILKED